MNQNLTSLEQMSYINQNEEITRNNLDRAKDTKDSEIIKIELLEKKRNELLFDIPNELSSILKRKLIEYTLAGLAVIGVLNVIIGMGFFMDFTKFLLPSSAIGIITSIMAGTYSYNKETITKRRKLKNNNIQDIDFNIQKHKTNVKQLEREIIRLQSNLYELEKARMQLENQASMTQMQQRVQQFQDYNNTASVERRRSAR